MLCLGMWDRVPPEFSLKIGCLTSQIRVDVQSCMSLEKERENLCLCVCVCLLVLMCSMNVNTRLCLCIFCYAACLQVTLLTNAERLLHNNEKWQKREYHSRLWPGLAGSVRPGAPRWQSPYFWEDGPVIGLIYFTPLPCNWTLGRRFNQSCQSLHWKGIWTESKVVKWRGFLFAWAVVSDR